MYCIVLFVAIIFVFIPFALCVSVPFGVLSYNNTKQLNSYAQNWGGAEGCTYFGQTFTNLQTLEMFSYYIAPDPDYNDYNKIYYNDQIKVAVIEWDNSEFAPIKTIWYGTSTLGTQGGYSSNTITDNHFRITYTKVTAKIGSALTLTPSKTYMLAFFFLASADYDIYILASVASGFGQAYSDSTRFPPSSSSYWSTWTNEGTFIYEVVVGDCNDTPCVNGGTCVGPDTCSCPNGYSGTTCQNSVCSLPCQNGTCIAPNTCSCSAGWQGTSCSQPMCNVQCNHGGICVAPNTCSCTDGWDGVDSGCNTPVCDIACVHGTCTEPNTCTCADNWQGLDCNTTGCDAQTTCGGHGVCNANGSCECLSGFDDSTNCGSCLADYLAFPTCFSSSLLPEDPTVLMGESGLYSITVRWYAVNGSSTNYTLGWYRDSTWQIIYQGPNTQLEVGSLSPNNTYMFRVAAHNKYGTSDFVYFNESTVDAGPPSAPSEPYFGQYSRSTINIFWNDSVTTGGMPILGYSVRISNSSDSSVWDVPSLQYQAVGLSPSTNYEFSVAAYNSLGISPFSSSTNFTTAAVMCGDGVCDPNEDCSSCFFDCNCAEFSACPVGGNESCSGRGTCFKGLCNCRGMWFGDTCQFSNELPVVFTPGNATTMKLELHGSTMQNQSSQNTSVSFDIFFATIREIDEAGGTVASFDLNMQQITFSKYDNVNSTTYKFEISLPNNANFTVNAKVYNLPSFVKFANESIQIPKNGLKYLLHIESWPFVALTHRLVLSMRTNTSAKGASADSCAPAAVTNVTTYTDEDSNNLRSIYFQRNGVTLYGKFLENAYFDDIYDIKVVKFAYNLTSETIDIEIPHFWDYVDLDPNFQVLLDVFSNPNDDCAVRSRKENKRTGKIIGGVVGSMFAVAIIGAAVYFYFERKRRQATIATLKRTASMSDVDSDNI